jgi:DHA3 family tetracycline resistance protein-like MFS transporter
MLRGSRFRPYPVYLFISGAFALFFMLYSTVAAVYRIEVVGLNPLQLVLVGAVLEGSVLLFEVPTGVVADTYGRKRSVIIGFLLMGTGFTFEGSVPVFAAVLAAQVIWGVGYTFISGALQVWIADELGEGTNLNRVYVRGEQADYLGSLLGVGASVLFATVALSLPLVLGGALTVALGLPLVLTMPERNFSPIRHEDGPRLLSAFGHVRQAAHTARRGVRLVRGRPVLLLLLAVAVFSGASSEGFDRLWEAHLLEDFGLPEVFGLDPVVWFGIINAGTLLLSLLAAEVINRRLSPGGAAVAARLLVALNVLNIAGVLAFALSGSFALAIGAFWLATLVRKVAYPLYVAWVNEGVAPGVRATVISMSSQADALGQVAGGPVVGAVGTFGGLRAALVVAGILLSPTLLLYGRAMRHGGKEPGLEGDGGAPAA